MREACIQRAIQAGVVTRVQFANAGRSDYKFRKVSTERDLRERERVKIIIISKNIPQTIFIFKRERERERAIEQFANAGRSDYMFRKVSIRLFRR
jgi:hypothetical protein